MKSTTPLILLVVCFGVLLPNVSNGQGIFLRANGAVNESMGGAATAAPLDCLGALAWNPATLSGLDNEVSFGSGLILPSCEISTHGKDLTYYQTGKERSYSTSGSPGAVPAPSMGFSYRPQCSRITYGMGMNAFGGAKLAYPYLGDDHVYTSLGPDGVTPVDVPVLAGLKTLNSDIFLLQVVSAASFQMTEQLSIGVGLTMTMAQVLCDPMFVSPPASGYQAGYPAGISSRYTWGGGFQIGAYYKLNPCWNFGFCYKSPQWMEPFRYNTYEQDAAGEPYYGGVRKLHLNVPDVITFGISYTGFEKTVIALDLRRFGYHSAGGDYIKMGWENIYGLNLGVQRIINERLTARVGYAYNDCPFDGAYTLANSATPMITQHVLFMGATIKVNDKMDMTLAYSHAFENSISGPIGAYPITVTHSIGADALTAGLKFHY